MPGGIARSLGGTVSEPDGTGTHSTSTGVPFVGYFSALYIKEYRIIIRKSELVSTGGLLVLPVEPRPRCPKPCATRVLTHI
jgi:hypothetical protein